MLRDLVYKILPYTLFDQIPIEVKQVRHGTQLYPSSLPGRLKGMCSVQNYEKYVILNFLFPVSLSHMFKTSLDLKL